MGSIPQSKVRFVDCFDFRQLDNIDITIWPVIDDGNKSDKCPNNLLGGTNFCFPGVYPDELVPRWTHSLNSLSTTVRTVSGGCVR